MIVNIPGSSRKDGLLFADWTDVFQVDVIRYYHHQPVFPDVVKLSPPGSFPILQNFIQVRSSADWDPAEGFCLHESVCVLSWSRIWKQLNRPPWDCLGLYMHAREAKNLCRSMLMLGWLFVLGAQVCMCVLK